MASKRAAVVVVTAFELSCPNCQADIPAPCGSFFWTANDTIPFSLQCPGCGCTLTIKDPTRRS